VGKEAYYEIRASAPEKEIERAARFLYLNRVGFSGLHRTNKRGEFNVPYGGRSPDILIRRELIRGAAEALRFAELEVADFEVVMSKAGPGDVVYCDPVYSLPSPNGSFVRYNDVAFPWADQVRLAFAAKQARERGALVLVSNVCDGAVHRLYHPFRPISLRRQSCVAASGENRRVIDEYLFVLAPSNQSSVKAAVARQLSVYQRVDDAPYVYAA
jgi:DNA adenine methylase